MLQDVRHRRAPERPDLRRGEDRVGLHDRAASLGGARRGDDDRIAQGGDGELEVGGHPSRGRHLDVAGREAIEPGRNAMGTFRRQIEPVPAVLRGRRGGDGSETAERLDSRSRQDAAGRVGDGAGHGDRSLCGGGRDRQRADRDDGQRESLETCRDTAGDWAPDGRRRVDHRFLLASPSEAVARCGWTGLLACRLGLLSASSRPMPGSDVNADFVPAHSCEGSAGLTPDFPCIQPQPRSVRTIGSCASGCQATALKAR